jgi:hypothetical protein
MKPTGESKFFILPPALLAEVQAAADEEQRAPADVVREALERYLLGRNRTTALSETPRVKKRTPAEAAARMLEQRTGTFLPEGETIRSMIEHGRA